MSEYSKSTYVILEKIYPIVAKDLNNNLSKFNAVIADFINKNHSQLNEIAPYDNIYFRQQEIDILFNAFSFSEDELEYMMHDIYYWKIPYNPQCAKEPYVILLMCCIRYFLIHKKMKEAEMATIYLTFSGKFYASIYAGDAFPQVAPSKYRTVMDYVVNNMLTNKHELKINKTVLGAIRKMDITYLSTYQDELCSNDISDDRFGKLIQQLRDRTRSWLMNIAKLYYEAYENKNFLNYETDNLSDGKEFRIADNDSLKATRYTNNTINYMVTNAVSLQICNKCKDSNVKALEIKDIMTSIIEDKNNIGDLTRVVNILVCDFMRNNPGKSIDSIDFLSHSIKAKPNTKEKYIIELKETILRWLDENSPNYRRRKNRAATALSYYRSVLSYLSLVVVYANKS